NIGDSRAERTAWQAARNTDTAPAYRLYLQQYPSGDFRPLAEQRLAILDAEEREFLAWEAAKSSNSPQAYQDFINTYPVSPYRELAEHKRDQVSPTHTGTLSTSMPGKMTFVEGGTFQMGSKEGNVNEKPVHTITVSDFYIGLHEVTFEEYDAYCIATGTSKPNDEGWGRARRPVINVSWNDAVTYCNWRSKQEGYQPVYTIRGNQVTANWGANGYRLPTEAEWEYAARERGKEVRFGNGKDTARAPELNFNAGKTYRKVYSEVGKYRIQTVPVGSLNSPNGLKLHDMSGNVWEWCWDWYDSNYYQSSPARDPRGSDAVSRRVLRGGSWFNSSADLRCANRRNFNPDNRRSFIGFRLTRASH
ncbi:MAG: formylglycine-generating enzyme family protein, partial [Chitinophagales bacterium]|nr:formylglycine-generating enzyme family protein [Chitinophagales bacterium]